ncbi:alanine racemase [Leptospira sp. WS58.C1]|uniref:alanine racemase n=1 Tax=Leptospira TaxID=171 RepID=UPI0002BDB672|nr:MULTISPECIES: alanine racemase [unclassified Leptospira]EMJ99483.1 alanine racemase, N-terminal domain protein [Leptospira sp. B5-022]MCR1792365.1 alanine racemase [Leptospira sp. id769339]
MYRKGSNQGLLWIFAVILLLIVFIKPKDNGAAYTSYFKDLNTELKENGPGKPIVLLDLDRLDSNLKLLKEKIKPPLSYRIVVKSLPSIDLLKYIVNATGSKRLMVFHSGDIIMLLNDPEFQKFDILLGKPMPIAALAEIYSKTKKEHFQNVQWLVDTSYRVEQYLDFAKKKDLNLKLSLEIDIGLHRGGFAKPEDSFAALELLQKNPKNVELSGYMGYEPHVASVPVIFENKTSAMEKSLKNSLEIYSDFIKLGKEKFPALYRKELVFNGGGSKTYRFYQKNPGVVNDVSLGSALVKPTDFDVESLEEHSPAVYIATPVLKKLEGTKIPFLESLSFLFPIWNPNQEVTYFIYGGAFSAKKESPKGLEDNSLFGSSTNQSILTGSRATSLDPDDHVFFRPTQSEKVMAEMGEIHLLRSGKLIGTWKTFIN